MTETYQRFKRFSKTQFDFFSLFWFWIWPKLMPSSITFYIRFGFLKLKSIFQISFNQINFVYLCLFRNWESSHALGGPRFTSQVSWRLILNSGSVLSEVSPSSFSVIKMSCENKVVAKTKCLTRVRNIED